MKAILPGSYDPITLGHLEIIRLAAKKYDEVFVTAFINPDKKYLYTTRERLEMLRLATADIPNVRVDAYPGRVVDYMRERGIERIVKGYRNDADLEYERRQAEYNLREGGYETELILAEAEYSHLSSTLARERIQLGEPLEEILPKPVIEFIKKH